MARRRHCEGCGLEARANEHRGACSFCEVLQGLCCLGKDGNCGYCGHKMKRKPRKVKRC